MSTTFKYKIEPKIKVLLFGVGSDFSLSLVRALSLVSGIEIHELTDQDGQNGINQKSKYVKSYKSINAPVRLIKPEQVVEHAHRIKADILLPITEAAIYFTAKHKAVMEKHLKLPAVPSANLFRKVVNKHELNVLLADKGFPVSKNIIVDERGPEELASLVNYPVLFKPVIGGGGWGIRYVDSAGQLIKLLQDWDHTYLYILQEFIPGSNVDCSLIAQDGKLQAATIQKPLKNRGLTFATGIKFVEDPKLRSMMERLVEAIGWNGIAHIDLRYDERDGSYKIIDFNSRYWSTLIGSVAAGINFPYLAIRQALELPFDKQEYKTIPFQMNSPAIKGLLKAAVGRSDSTFRYKYSELGYSLKDWKPELIRAWNHFIREFIKHEREPNYSKPDLQQLKEWGGTYSD